ncbi:MAG: hypothetical protein KBF11_09190, partial [Desulfomicrobium sp.]|nr:hypothetical protein [Desulfomicrobium sp.]
MKKISLILPAVIICMLFLAGIGFAADDQQTSETTVLSSFFRAKIQEVETLQAEVNTLQELVGQREAEFKAELEAAGARLQTIEVMARMVKTNPYDMRVALAEAKYSQMALAKAFGPLEALAKELGAKAVIIESLKEDLERKWATGLGKDVRQDVQTIRKNVAAVGQKVTDVQGQLEKVTAQVTAIQARNAEWVGTFETQLPLIWRTEFLDGAEFRLFPAPGADVRKDLADWFLNMKAFFVSQYSSVTTGAGDWAGTFVLFWIPFVVIGFVSHRFLADRFENADAGGRLTSAVAILFLSLALSLLAAFLSGKVKQTSFLLVCTHVFMLLGVQGLGWVFRNV